MKPALCRNGKCDYASTSPNACLRFEPSSFEQKGAAAVTVSPFAHEEPGGFLACKIATLTNRTKCVSRKS